MIEKEKVILREIEQQQCEKNSKYGFLKTEDLLRDDFMTLPGALFKDKVNDYTIQGYCNQWYTLCGFVIFDRAKLNHVLFPNTKIEVEDRLFGFFSNISDTEKIFWNSLIDILDKIFQETIKEYYKIFQCFCLQDKYVIKYIFKNKEQEPTKWTTEKIYNLLLQIVGDLDGHLAEIDKKIEELARDILLQLGVKKEDL